MPFLYRINSAAEWADERARGRSSFIVRVGLLRWALTAFLLLTILHVVTGGLSGGVAHAAARLLITAVFMAIGGWVFGALMWRRYSKLFG